MAFSNVRKRLGNIANNASKKSGELVEAAKLNAEIGRLQVEIEDIQFELGKAYYEENKDHPDGPYRESLEQINRLEQEIRLCNEKLLAQKNLLYCPGCDTVVSREDEFCSKCGLQVPQLGEHVARVCRNCGEELAENQRQCAKCGILHKS